MNDSISKKKSDLRNQMRLRRALIADTDAWAGAAALHASAYIEAVLSRPSMNSNPKTIAVYCALAGELDTKPLIVLLRAQGVRLALPRVHDEGAPLHWQCWNEGDELVRGRYRILEPQLSAPSVIPDAIVCPLLAFDRTGARLGYGGGYYDRSIAQLREAGRPPLLIGYGFAQQEVANVPVDIHDCRMDVIITDAGVVYESLGDVE